MKRYIKASTDYNSIFRKIVKYYKSIVEDAGCSYCSYTDYSVRPDWDNGGIRFQLEWDGGNISENDVMNNIETYFGSGIRCSRAWGKWDHQITVFVEEYRCR